MGKSITLTPGELSQTVSSISIVSGNTVIDSASPASLAGARTSGEYAPGSSTLVPISPGSTQVLSIRLTTCPGASQIAFSRFFVELSPGISIYPEGGIALERSIPLAGVQPVLVIMPVLSPLQQWRSPPAWAQDHRRGIIARILSEFRGPYNYEY